MGTTLGASVCVCVCVEREREREREAQGRGGGGTTTRAKERDFQFLGSWCKSRQRKMDSVKEEGGRPRLLGHLWSTVVTEVNSLTRVGEGHFPGPRAWVDHCGQRVD